MHRTSASSRSRSQPAETAASTAQQAASGSSGSSSTERPPVTQQIAGLPGNRPGTTEATRRSRTGLFSRFRSDNVATTPEAIFKATLRDWSKEGPAHEKSARAQVAAQIKQAYKLNAETLYLDNNKISSLPDCLDQLINLQTFCVMATSLQALPALPPRLTCLRVEFTSVSALPDPLPAGLSTLELTRNHLTSLPDLPVGLMDLIVPRNRLTSLPNLPASVWRLNAEGNRLRTLPTGMAEGLKEINLDWNLLSHLPVLPNSVTHINVSDNRLTGIERLPDRLIKINANGNRLAGLPPQLPARLRTLCIERNTLTALPPLPASLKQLHARGNPLDRLPILPEDLNWLAVDNSALAAFPSDLANRLSEYETMRPAIAELRRLQAQSAVEFERLQDLPGRLAQSLARHFHPSPMPDQVPVVVQRPASMERTRLMPEVRTQDGPLPTVEERDRQHALALQQIASHFDPSALSEQMQAAAQRVLSSERMPPVPQVGLQDGLSLPLEVNDFQQALSLQRLYDMRDESPTGASRETGFAARAWPVDGPVTRDAATRSSGNWSFPAEGDTAAAGFNNFQSRANQTAEYRDTRLRPGLVARLDTVVAAMDASPTLRQICFNIADESVASCGDGVALALNDMELARVNHLAETGSMSVESLFNLGEGLFKLHAVNEIAVNKIDTLKCDGIEIDDVEIRLAYQTELGQELQLPGVAGAMLYRGAAYVTPSEIRAAGEQVRRQLEGNASVRYLAQWKP